MSKVVMSEKRIISPEMQLAEVRALCKRSGFDPDVLVLFEDMNISGRKGRDKRPGWDSQLTAIEAGEVVAVFSYSLSRLSRKVADIIPFAEVCGRRHPDLPGQRPEP